MSKIEKIQVEPCSLGERDVRQKINEIIDHLNTSTDSRRCPRCKNGCETVNDNPCFCECHTDSRVEELVKEYSKQKQDYDWPNSEFEQLLRSFAKELLSSSDSEILYK